MCRCFYCCLWWWCEGWGKQHQPLPAFVQQVVGSGWRRDNVLERRFREEEVRVTNVGGGGGDHEVVVLGKHGVSSVAIASAALVGLSPRAEAERLLEARLVLHLFLLKLVVVVVVPSWKQSQRPGLPVCVCACVAKGDMGMENV